MSHLEVPLTTTRWQENTTSRHKRAHTVVENEAIYLTPNEYTKAVIKDEELINAKLCFAPTRSYAGKQKQKL
jgi:hypothetical protein